MKVKVCGLTSYMDASFALDQGVDALGFNFYPRSPRYIDPCAAQEIIRRLPPFAATVGVFVNVTSPEELAESACCAGVRILQLHGDESADYCSRLSGWTLIKAVRVGAAFDPDSLAGYPVQAYLLDAKDDLLFGGMGRTFDWNLAKDIEKMHPVILAGGLHAGNVREAIRAVRPYGVDVCSGVESRPGRKDPDRVRAFMNEVRDAIRSL